MAEPLRRRLRARLLSALSGAAGGVGDPLVRGILHAASQAARWTKYERISRENLALAMPELTSEQHARILRNLRSHTERIVHEWLTMAGPRAAGVLATVECDAAARRLRELSAGGRGTILVTAHIGNWELLAASLRREGFDGAVVGYKKRNDSSSDWLVRMRAAHGVTSFAQDESPRAALELLRRGNTLGLLCDLEVRRLSNVVAPFFGRPALTMTAPAALARATGLPLVPVRCVARGERYEMIVDEPLELARSRSRDAAQLDLLTRLNAVYERWIRNDPDQWVWYRPRWSAPSPDSAAPRKPTIT